MELVEWLLVVLDEHEEVAQREQRSAPDWDRVAGYADSTLVQMMSPAAVLADIAAKRVIIELHESYASEKHSGPSCWVCGPGGFPFPCQTLRALASAFAHCPGYLEEWRVHA